MLERDALIVAMTGGRHPFREAEILADAYVHALAEQQRAWTNRFLAWSEYDGAHTVADLIDPTAHKARVQNAESYGEQEYGKELEK